MILHIPDELDMPLRYIAEFAAHHGCWLEAKYNHDRERIEFVLVMRRPTPKLEPIGGSK